MPSTPLVSSVTLTTPVSIYFHPDPPSDHTLSPRGWSGEPAAPPPPTPSQKPRPRMVLTLPDQITCAPRLSRQTPRRALTRLPIVCALWKNKLWPWDGINNGEFRGKGFQVVVAGCH